MSAKEDYVPSHPDLFEVKFGSGDYRSALIARKDFEPGDVVTYLKDLTVRPQSYATMQCGPGPDDHVIPSGDLRYVNHSCDPNVALDFRSPDRAKWHMVALKRIAIGDPVTFFYPSTEWLMDQPFDCTCGALSCLRRIEGAAVLSKEELFARGTINLWISDAIRERDFAEPQSRDGAN